MEGKRRIGERPEIFFLLSFMAFQVSFNRGTAFSVGWANSRQSMKLYYNHATPRAAFPIAHSCATLKLRVWTSVQYKVTTLSILKNVAGKRHNSPLSELSSLNLSPLYVNSGNLESSKWNDQEGRSRKRPQSNSCTENGVFYGNHRTTECKSEHQCGYVTHAAETD